MYLLLKTYANCDIEDAALTSCAVVEPTKEALDWWLGLMDQAAHVSAKIGKDVTLSFMDYTPDCYQGFPDIEDFAEEDLDPGFCVMQEPPYPASEEGYSEETAYDLPAWNEPVRQSYCEIRVSAHELQWFYGPKYGSVEEYTATLFRKDLEEMYAAQQTPTENALP